MDLFMVFFVIVFLAVLVSGAYLTILQELHKKSKGISVEYDSMEEIEKILKEKLGCPFVKEIVINKKGNIEFRCKYDSHTGVIQDGKLYIDKLVRKFSSHRDIEESWYLQKYIERVFYPEKEEEKEELELKFTKYIKIFNISRIIKYIMMLCIVIWIFRQIGGLDSLKSRGVSQMCFTDYSEDITVGEALKSSFSNCKWNSNKIGDGLYHVTFSGYGADGSLLTILFQINGSECSIKSIVWGGEDLTLLQGVLLEAIYENAISGDKGEGGVSGISGLNIEGDSLELNETDTMIGLEESTMKKDAAAYADLEAFIDCICSYSDPPDLEGEELQAYFREQYDIWKSGEGFFDVIQDENGTFHYRPNEVIDYLGAYSSIIEDVYLSYDEYCEYTLYDIDGDGIKELITSQGTCEADWANDVYTIENGYVSMIGEFYGSVMFYAAEDGNGLYAVYGHGGFQNIDQVTKNGNQLQVETIMSGEIGEEDYYSNDNPINVTTVTDDSLLIQ